MNAIPNNPAQIKEKMQKEIKRAEDKYNAWVRLQTVYADIIDESKVKQFTDLSLHKWGKHYLLKYNVESIQEALELAERMNPINLFLIKNACTSFAAEGSPEDTKNEDHSELVGPWTFHIDYDDRYLRIVSPISDSENVEIRFMVPKDKCKEQGIYIDSYTEEERGKKITKYRVINEAPHFRTGRVNFWTSDKSIKNCVIW